MYETLVPKGSTADSALRSLVEQISKTTGLQVETQEFICFTTDNSDLSSMLDSLRDAIQTMKPVNGKHRKNGKKKEPKVVAAKNDAMTSHTRRNVESEDELIKEPQS